MKSCNKLVVLFFVHQSVNAVSTKKGLAQDLDFSQNLGYSIAQATAKKLPSHMEHDVAN